MIPMGNTCRKRAASAILYPRKDGMDVERSEIDRVFVSPWGKGDPTLAALKNSPYGEMLQKAFALLDREVLYESWMHGAGHIERVMVLSAELAREGALPLRETELLLLAASYHDIGRVDDSRDPAHGCRSAEMLSSDPQFARRMEDVTGEERRALLAAIEAHSLSDADRNTAAAHWGADVSEGSLFHRLATGLKDADNLDRVRLGDLDTKHLRTPAAVALVPFADELYRQYKSNRTEKE